MHALSQEVTEPPDYRRFIHSKTQTKNNYGFSPIWRPEFLFDFQQSLVEWALERGRAAIFADCGMGKTPMQLVWAENVVRKTNGRVLILTPLAVASQTVREAAKFGIEARRSHDGEAHPGITVTNYEQLHKFDPAEFSGVVCDESSILKSFDGARKQEITVFMRKMPYRLLATATAAPNDFIELGTSSEALGYLGYMDMLNRFFKNDQNNSSTKRGWALQGSNLSGQKWRFKGHAELPFWRWICSWARAIRRPSDIGFDDGPFILPPLIEREHLIETDGIGGYLFNLPAITLNEQRQEQRETMDARCAKVAELVNHTNQPALVWCHLNDEGNLLEKLIPDAVQVAGSDRDEVKEERFMAFADGQARVLITKPKIGAWGLNFQHCNHITFFPSHSFEQYYQGIRRCWRFGQDRPVTVDIVTTEGGHNVLQNLQRKAAQSDEMFSNLVAEMNHSISLNRSNSYTKTIEVPSWLSPIK